MGKLADIANRFVSTLGGLSLLGLLGCTPPAPAPLPPGSSGLTDCTPMPPVNTQIVQTVPTPQKRISQDDPTELEDEEEQDEEYALHLTRSEDSEEEEEENEEKPRPKVQSSKSEVTYEGYVKDLISKNCLRCHDKTVKEQPNLKTWIDVKKVKAKVAQSIIDKTMPPKEAGGPLIAAQISRITRWKDAGFPQKSKSSSDEEEEEEEEEGTAEDTSSAPVLVPMMQQGVGQCPTPQQPVMVNGQGAQVIQAGVPQVQNQAATPTPKSSTKKAESNDDE